MRDNAPSSIPNSLPYRKKSSREFRRECDISNGDIVSHTFAIKNNIRRFPEDIDGVNNVLACRADGKSNVERHREDECTR